MKIGSITLAGFSLLALAGCGAAISTPTTSSLPSVASTPTAVPSETVAPTPDPYAGWKTYTSAYEGASFLYPSTWSLSIAPEPVSNGDVADGNVVALTSPSGFVVHFEAPDQGQGGGCSGNVSIQQVTKLTAQANNPLYLTVVSHSGEMDFGVYDVVPPASNNYTSAAAVPTVGEAICDFNPCYTGLNHHANPLNLISFLFNEQAKRFADLVPRLY